MDAPLHVGVPGGSGVDRHLQTMLFLGHSRVFEGSVQREVVRRGLTTVDVLSPYSVLFASGSAWMVHIPIGRFRPGWPKNLIRLVR